MSTFVALPNELIERIFRNFEHIDDALNLANCCRTCKAYLSTKKDTIKVMRVILGNTRTHYNDIQLYRLSKSTTNPSPAHGSNVETFLSCYNSDVDKLDDDEVLAIVGLRQRIRPVQNLYLNWSIQDQYRRSNFPSKKKERSDIVECMFQKTPTVPAASENIFSANRFSDAVVAYWVLIEARKLVISILTQARDYRAHTQYTRILESFWYESGLRSLLQALDMLEVHDFIYGFLIRKAYYRSWAEGHEEMERIDKNWARYLQQVESCVNPMDAAWVGSMEGELFDPTVWKTLPFNGYFYLRYEEIPPALKKTELESLSVANILEFNLGLKLLRLDEVELGATGNHDHLVEAWDYFRRNWPTTARGSLLWSLKSSEDFLEHLKRYAPKPEPMHECECECECESNSKPEPEPEPEPELEFTSAMVPWEDPFPVILSRKALEEFSLWLDETMSDRDGNDETNNEDQELLNGMVEVGLLEVQVPTWPQ